MRKRRLSMSVAGSSEQKEHDAMRKRRLSMSVAGAEMLAAGLTSRAAGL